MGSQYRHSTQTNPRLWKGSLSFAGAVRGSNSIEGYKASLEDAVAAIDAEPPLNPEDETALALFGHRDALTHIVQAPRDPFFELSKQFLKSLHFMMLNHDLTRDPCRYWPGSIRVVEQETFATQGDVAGVVRG